MNAIEIAGLCKQFRGKRMTRVDALKNLDLQVAAGEVFGFLGPNGAGKSTTIKLVMGLLRPSSGRTSMYGVDSAQAVARRRLDDLAVGHCLADEPHRRGGAHLGRGIGRAGAERFVPTQPDRRVVGGDDDRRVLVHPPLGLLKVDADIKPFDRPSGGRRLLAPRLGLAQLRLGRRVEE